MYCTNCGHKNEEAARFCEKCGQPMVKIQEKSGTPSKKNKKNGKRIFALGAVILMAILAVAILPRLRTQYDFIGEYNKYGLAMARLEEKYGYVDENKKVVIPVEYDKVGEFKANGLVIVEKEKMSGIYDFSGNEVVPTAYTNITIGRQNSKSGLIPVELGEETLFLNQERKPAYDAVTLSSTDGFFIVSSEEKLGCVDQYGKIVLSCVYDKLDIVFSLAGKLKISMDGNVNYMSPDGVFLYDEVSKENESGMAIVRKGEKYGCINSQTVEIIPVKYREVLVGEKQENGYFPVTIDGTENFMNYSGDMMYASVGNYAENGLAAASDEYGFYGYIDWNGTEVIPFNYDEAGDFGSNGLAKVKIGDHYGYINKLGISVIETKYDYAGDFSDNGLALVQEGYTYNFISMVGSEQYEYVSEVKNDFSIAKKDGKYGLTDKDGNLLTSIWYDKIYNDYSFLEAGIVRARTNGKYVLLNSKGEEITAYYDGIRDLLCEGTVACWRDGKYGLVNTEGKEVVALQYAGIEEYDGVRGMWSVLGSDGTEALINANGRTILSGEYERVIVVGDSVIAYDGQTYTLHDGEGKTITDFAADRVIPISSKFAMFSVEKNEIWNVFDETGKQAFDIDFDFVMMSDNYILGADTNGKYGIWNLEGEEIIPCQYDGIYSVNSGLVNMQIDGKHGVINMENDLIIPALYDEISIHAKNIIVKKDDRYGAFSYDGTVKLPLEYEDIRLIAWSSKTGEEYYKVKLNGLYGVYDENWNPVVPVEYTVLDNYLEYESTLRAKDEDGLWSLWDKNGNLLISNADWISGVGTNGLVTVECNYNGEYGFHIYDAGGNHKYFLDYDNVSMFDEGLAMVKKDGMYGFINTKGEQVADCMYEDYDYFGRDGVTSVMLNGKWGYIDEAGNELTEFIYSEAGEMTNGRAAVAKGENKKGILEISMTELFPCEYDDIYINYRSANLTSGNREICVNEAGNVLEETIKEVSEE